MRRDLAVVAWAERCVQKEQRARRQNTNHVKARAARRAVSGHLRNAVSGQNRGRLALLFPSRLLASQIPKYPFPFFCLGPATPAPAPRWYRPWRSAVRRSRQSCSHRKRMAYLTFVIASHRVRYSVGKTLKNSYSHDQNYSIDSTCCDELWESNTRIKHLPAQAADQFSGTSM